MPVRMAGTVSLAAIIMLLTGVGSQYSVTFSSKSLCAVTGSTVTISCKHNAYYSIITKSEWYLIHNSDREERVLSKDPEFSGRVSVSTMGNGCELTVRGVRVRDSGVYNFRFRTSSRGWISASSGVQLTVTDLQVKVDTKTVGQGNLKMTCSSTCSLSKNLKYSWYKNDHRLNNYADDTSIMFASTDYKGMYSCKVDSSHHRSPPVCVLGEDCWGVTYNPERVCAMKGSSVDLSCSYKYPGELTVTKSVWFIKEQTGVEPVDVREDEDYQGRVQNRQISQNDCSMKITDLRERDAQTYRFKFYTNDPGGKYTGRPGVTLSVTDLEVTVSQMHSAADLICRSTCPVNHYTTYVWYKNGQPVYYRHGNGRYLYVKAANAGSYTCAIKGHEEHRSPAVCVLNPSRCWSVSYSAQTICALIGSSVDIHSYYTFPGQQPVPQPAWYIRLLTQDKELSPADGRVEFFSVRANMTTLRLNHLTQSDAAEYLLRFKAPFWMHTHNSAGVSLSVTGLQVKVEASSDGQTVTLICSSTCTLPNNPTYIWYKNGQPVSNQYSRWLYLYDSTVDTGSYSCTVRGYEELRSPAVCVFDESSCWSVSYSTQTICALIGSSVDIHSYYTFPDHQPDPQPVWYIRLLKQDKELSPADGRVFFFSDRANMITMRLNHLTQSDSAEYLLRFKAPFWKHIHSSAGVSLSVTGLQVKVEAAAEQQTVTLTCSSTCTLPNNPTYIWYKNGQSVSHCRSASCFVAVLSEEVSYSCAVEGNESLLSPPVYPPRNTRAVLVPSGERVQGDSVTLSCSSDADPPVLSYSWFKQRAAAETLLTTGQNYSITNISSQHSGLYYCTAHNQLGQHSSTPVHLDVLYPPRNTRAVLVPSGERVEGESVTLSCSSDANPPVLSYSWFKQRVAADTPLTTGQNYSITSISSQHSGLYYCTAHNQLGQHNSTPTYLDVLYPPRNPSLSHFVTGDSITLVCVSDSKPASSYTWYSKAGSDITPVGNSTNLTVPLGVYGFFYCEAKNQYGSFNSSDFSFTSDSASAKYAASAVAVVFLLAFFAAFLWLRRRAAGTGSRSEEISGKDVSTPVYDNVSAMTSNPTRTEASDDEDDVQYTSVHFTRSRIQEVPLYSTVQQPSALQQEEEVEYAAVNLVKKRTVRNNEAPIYSTVQRT